MHNTGPTLYCCWNWKQIEIEKKAEQRVQLYTKYYLNISVSRWSANYTGNNLVTLVNLEVTNFV